MNIIYEHSYCDNILLAGDTNSKIGSSQEFIPGIDEDIGERIILDKTKNRHGQEMFDFLTESKMCVCNGRVTPEHNSYTFVHTRGRSVIDYVCVPIDCLNQFLQFKVNAARDMLNLPCNIDDIDTDLSKMIPDHSILTLKFSTHRVFNMPSEPADQVQRGQYDQTGGNTAYDQNHIYFKRYGVKNILRTS